MNKHTPKHQLATYDSDFHLWSQTQAAAIREGKFAEIDLENVAEEIESLGRSDRREIRSRLHVLLVHLLKWQAQAEKRKGGWEISIDEARESLDILVGESPSLKNFPAMVLDEVYERARRKAAKETRLPASRFPAECPFDINDVLDENFLPGA
jgi:Domain of unknown function DUF29